MNPWNATSPKSRLQHSSLNVLHTDSDGWSIATMLWNSEPWASDHQLVHGLRWDGDVGNVTDLGNPVSRSYGTWFVLPDAVAQATLAAANSAGPLTPAPQP